MKTDPVSVRSSRPSCGPQMRCSLTAEYHNWEGGFTSPCRGINEGHDMTSAIVYHGRVAVGGQAQVCDKLGQALLERMQFQQLCQGYLGTCLQRTPYQSLESRLVHVHLFKQRVCCNGSLPHLQRVVADPRSERRPEQRAVHR